MSAGRPVLVASRLTPLLEDVYVFQGLGSIGAAHTPADIQTLGNACRSVARRLRGYV